MKGLAQNPSRWHGITDSTKAGGDVHTVTVTITVAAATVTTANRAADCCGISNDSAGSA